jgi:hypothetical protein
MKCVIAGGRDLTDFGLVVEAVHLSDFTISQVVSGACGIDADDPAGDGKKAKGADGIGEDWAWFNGIPMRRFYAAWKRLGTKLGRYATLRCPRMPRRLSRYPAAREPPT